MPSTIVTNRPPLEESNKEKLRKLFGGQEYALLRDVISAHCVVAQVECMNARLYPETERANEVAELKQKEAAKYRGFLDVLDDLERKEEQWFTARLETSR